MLFCNQDKKFHEIKINFSLFQVTEHTNTSSASKLKIILCIDLQNHLFFCIKFSNYKNKFFYTLVNYILFLIYGIIFFLKKLIKNCGNARKLHLYSVHFISILMFPNEEIIVPVCEFLKIRCLN